MNRHLECCHGNSNIMEQEVITPVNMQQTDLPWTRHNCMCEGGGAQLDSGLNK